MSGILNDEKGTKASADFIKESTGKNNVSYISNQTQSGVSDIYNSVNYAEEDDYLNAFILMSGNDISQQQGGESSVMGHSAGGYDTMKALDLLIRNKQQLENTNFAGVGSPVGVDEWTKKAFAVGSIKENEYIKVINNKNDIVGMLGDIANTGKYGPTHKGTTTTGTFTSSHSILPAEGVVDDKASYSYNSEFLSTIKQMVNGTYVNPSKVENNGDGGVVGGTE